MVTKTWGEPVQGTLTQDSVQESGMVLTYLGVVSTDNDHECRWHNALRKAQEESLRPQSFIRCDTSGGHCYCSPSYHGETDSAAEMESLKQIGQRAYTGQHAKVEQRRGPTQTCR